MFINKTLPFLTNIRYRHFYSSETGFKHTLIIKLCYQVLTVANAKQCLPKPYFDQRVFKLCGWAWQHSTPLSYNDTSLLWSLLPV